MRDLIADIVAYAMHIIMIETDIKLLERAQLSHEPRLQAGVPFLFDDIQHHYDAALQLVGYWQEPHQL